MERLTKYGKTSHENGVCCTYFNGNECTERMGNCTDNCPWEEAVWSRLAAYEDTGLAPEEILTGKELAEIAIGLQQLNRIRSVFSDERMEELMQAEKEGRCVVLPAGGYRNKDGEDALKSAMNTCFYHNNPATRFIADAVAEKLTREEAQEALKEREERP